MSILPLADTSDVAARLGQASLTDTQTTQAQLLLDLGTDAILSAVDRTSAWAGEATDTPAGWKSILLDLVARAMANPTGARSESEQLGSYQHSVSFPAGAGAVELTPGEELRARRALYGANSGSATLSSLADTLFPDDGTTVLGS